MTLILKIDPSKPSMRKIRIAADVIRKGGIVVFPTETVYGIGANALDARAVEKIFRIKKRPRNNPLIIHVSDMRMANNVAIIPRRYQKIIDKLWPAPLTIRMKSRKRFPKAVTGGMSSISVRMPSNRIAHMLIEESGVPIAAPSANMSKRPSSTKGSHAKLYFNGKVDVIIDGGPSRFGLESTILELDKFIVPRPGVVTVQQLQRAFGRKIRITDEARGLKDALKPTTPGMMYRHYAPAIPLFMFTGDMRDLPKIISGIRGFAFIGSAESCRSMSKKSIVTIPLGPQGSPIRIAANLFDGLITLDSKNARFAIAESYDEKGVGLAIMNRLRKACGHKYFSNREELERLLSKI